MTLGALELIGVADLPDLPDGVVLSEGSDGLRFATERSIGRSTFA